MGFFGTVWSYRFIGGRKSLYLTFSTWCADVKYRTHIFGGLKELCAQADIAADFTPNEPSREIMTKMFGFKYVNDTAYIFRPVPFLSAKKVTVSFIRDASELADDEQRVIFTDHQKYGLKCAVFERDGEKGCVFYYVHKRRRWKRRVPWFSLARAAKVFNKKLFTENLREIVSKIQKHEGFMVQFWLDKSFSDGEISHPMYSLKKVHRIIRSECEAEYDLLYSELAILDI